MTANTITIDEITLTHRLFYDSGYPTASTAGERNGNLYSISRDLDTDGRPWALWMLNQGNQLIRHLTAEEVEEYEFLLQAEQGRSRQTEHESAADDATAEVESGRTMGSMPADL